MLRENLEELRRPGFHRELFSTASVSRFLAKIPTFSSENVFQKYVNMSFFPGWRQLYILQRKLLIKKVLLIKSIEADNDNFAKHALKVITPRYDLTVSRKTTVGRSCTLITDEREIMPETVSYITLIPR